MKAKRLLIFSVSVFLLFALCGCSFNLYGGIASSKNVKLEYVEIKTSEDAEFAEVAAARSLGCVVTVVSSANVETGYGIGVLSSIYSGLILNDEGYILTTYQAAHPTEFVDGTTYEGDVSSAYAVLSDIYGDTTHYRIDLVDKDEDAGLALFKFYDSFSYYTDSSKSETQSGFQFKARFTDKTVSVGANVVSIGNAAGYTVISEDDSASQFTDLQVNVMSGTVLEDECDPDIFGTISYLNKEYASFLITAPVSEEMIGGGVFDENGYLIGYNYSKLYSTTDSGVSILPRVSIAYKSDLLIDYIDQTSEKLQTPIPYTIARVANEEAAA